MLFCPRTSESHSPVPLPDPDNRSLFVAGPFRSEITSTYKKNTSLQNFTQSYIYIRFSNRSFNFLGKASSETLCIQL
jgi:hypothetical protein